MRLDAEKAKADVVAHAWRIMEVATLEGTEIVGNAGVVGYWVERALKDLDKKDTDACIKDLLWAQRYNMKSLGLFQGNKNDLTYLPPDYALAVFRFFNDVNELEQHLAAIDPVDECRGAVPGMRLVAVDMTIKHINRSYTKMEDALSGREKGK